MANLPIALQRAMMGGGGQAPPAKRPKMASPATAEGMMAGTMPGMMMGASGSQPSNMGMGMGGGMGGGNMDMEMMAFMNQLNMMGGGAPNMAMQMGMGMPAMGMAAGGTAQNLAGMGMASNMAMAGAGMQMMPAGGRPPTQMMRPGMPQMAAPVPKPPERSPEEMKEVLLKLGIPFDKKTTVREMQSFAFEVERQLKRAEATKKLTRSADQRLLSWFTEGLCPGGEKLLKALEAGSDPNTVSEGQGSGFAAGMTPLLAAASWGKLEEVRILIAAGADLNARTPNFNKSVIHLVAGGNINSWGAEKTVCLLRLLVDKAPHLINTKDDMGKTPLDCAKYEKQRQSVTFLSSLQV